MTKFALHLFCLVIISAFVQVASAKSVTFDVDKEDAIAETKRIVEDIINASYPELIDAQIKVKTFDSNADYFRSRFSFSRFFTFQKLHYLILVNPKIYKTVAPKEGLRAIIAHELAHVAYYRRHNCIELLGLIALQSNSFTARFERGADLQAIKRGYGEGLKLYRQWLYKNIPVKNLSAKKRDYFSPEEIDQILELSEYQPELIDYFIKKVPRNLEEIQQNFK